MSTSFRVNNRTKRVVASQKLLDGFNKVVPTTQSTVLGGTSYTHAQIQQNLQSLIDASSAVDAARATWKNAVQTERGQYGSQSAFVASLKQSLRVTYGNAVDTLSAFGLSPTKARVVSPTTRVAAAAKSRATRAARHTQGKVQKLDVSGNVTGIIVTPVTAPAASAPSPAATTATAPATPAASPSASTAQHGS